MWLLSCGWLCLVSDDTQMLYAIFNLFRLFATKKLNVLYFLPLHAYLQCLHKSHSYLSESPTDYFRQQPQQQQQQKSWINAKDKYRAQQSMELCLLWRKWMHSIWHFNAIYAFLVAKRKHLIKLKWVCCIPTHTLCIICIYFVWNPQWSGGRDFLFVVYRMIRFESSLSWRKQFASTQNSHSQVEQDF